MQQRNYYIKIICFCNSFCGGKQLNILRILENYLSDILLSTDFSASVDNTFYLQFCDGPLIIYT